MASYEETKKKKGNEMRGGKRRVRKQRQRVRERMMKGKGGNYTRRLEDN